VSHDPDKTPTIARRGLRLFGRVLGIPLGVVVMLALRLTSRKAGVALMYHSVEEREGDERRELVPPHPARLFARQVRHLVRFYRVVPAAELRHEAARRRRGERFPVAITFDDDLACHADVALPILRGAGAHATFFLSGASLERPYAFWWERLRIALERGIPRLAELVGAPAGPGDSVGMHELGRYVIALPAEEVERVADRLGEAVGPDGPDTGMPAAHVHRLVESGMTVGFHTLRHPFLSRLDDESLARALRDGREALAVAAGGPLETIGYPYGGADPRVADAARAAGFTAGFTTQHVAVEPGVDPLLQGRVGPSRRAVGAMALQLAVALLRAGNGRSSPVRGRTASAGTSDGRSASGADRA
jgi:peptidoglycan/xylan/chitin deacetylase (PgdA/CDA1 family)